MTRTCAGCGHPVGSLRFVVARPDLMPATLLGCGTAPTVEATPGIPEVRYPWCGADDCRRRILDSLTLPERAA